MTQHHRPLVFVAAALGVIALATPAAASDWFSIHLGTAGFGVSFGSTDWWVYGNAWYQPRSWTSYDAVLAGYGEWIWVDGLGTVWRPYVAVDWRPYTYGRWVYTGLGWTWVSYEPWGYFPHHYGNWAYTMHGWVWIPGYTYYAANVTWVRWGGYVGWYPCPPPGWSHTARAYHHGYRDGYRDGYHLGRHDAELATYVQWSHLGAHDVSRHAVAPDELHRSMARVSPAAVGAAPTRSELQRHGANTVAEANLERRELRIGERTVTVQRPAGMSSTVRQHARSTVERALVPADRPATPNRSVTPAQTAGRDQPRSREAEPPATPRSRLGSVPSGDPGNRSRPTGAETQSNVTSRQTTGRLATPSPRVRPSVADPGSGRIVATSRPDNRRTEAQRPQLVESRAATATARSQVQRTEPKTVITSSLPRGPDAAAQTVRPRSPQRAQTATRDASTRQSPNEDRRARSQPRGAERVSADRSSGTGKTPRR